MALDEHGRPSTEALLTAMKRDMDEQVNRLNDNRIFLIAVVDELTQENFGLKSQLAGLQAAEGSLTEE